MQMPLQITFRDMKSSAAVEDRIRQRAAEMDQFYDRIMRCHVVVHAPHRRHHQGKLYHVRIDLTVPGSELVVNREPTEHHAYEDVHVAVRDAFDAAERQLADYARRQRGAVKAHEAPPLAHVARLFPEEGYGFIEAAGGTEVYFHRNSVLGDAFERLEVGTEVEFVEEPGDQGPQASTVRVTGKRRVVE
ncbi:MAG: HPF/RaiA family ribosome-associated protein [Candidatus Binatia bacterium]